MSAAIAPRSTFVLAVAAALAACRTEQTLETPDPSWERMEDQEKVLPYEEDPLLPHGMAMQPPPRGTMPAADDVADPALTTGLDPGGVDVDRIPLALNRATVIAGRRRFETFCATCHGVLGDGASAVADHMELRKPPSFHEPPIRRYPPGRLYRAIREGYGLMPSYAAALRPAEAWSVVAYVQALQLARAASIADLPADVRAELAVKAP